MPAPNNYIVSGHVHGDADRPEVEVTVYTINEKMETEDFDVDGIVTGEDLNDFKSCAEKIKNAIPAFSDCTKCRIEYGNGESGTSKFETTLVRYSKGSFLSGYRDLIVTFKTSPQMYPGMQPPPGAQVFAGDDRSELIKILRQQEDHLSSIRGMMMFLIILTIVSIIAGIVAPMMMFNSH